jgi:hypothetical protein
VDYKGVEGFNNNRRSGHINQPTSRFVVKKGDSETSVFPASPDLLPDKIWELE